MIEFVMDYMEQRNAFAKSQREQELLVNGITAYLTENGIAGDEKRPYFCRYVAGHLDLIEACDLKLYFIMYPFLSRIYQIITEFREDGSVSDSRRDDLYQSMNELYRCGLGEKYVPAVEVKQILGLLS